MNRHHTKKPTELHRSCETKGCLNYYNISYKNTKHRCKPCRDSFILCEHGETEDCLDCFDDVLKHDQDPRERI